MKRYRKLIISIIAAVFVLFFSLVGNEQFEDFLKQNVLTYDKNQVQFVHWEQNGDAYISKKSSQIHIMQIDKYVSNIILELDIDREIPGVYVFYYDEQNPNFSGKTKIYYEQPVTDKAVIPIDRYVKGLRIDLGNIDDVVLQDITIKLPTYQVFSFVSSFALSIFTGVIIYSILTILLQWKQEKRYQIIYISCSIFLLIFVHIGGLLNSNNSLAETENRTGAEKPTFNRDTLSDYPAKFEAYYNDNFPMRSKLVDGYGYLKYFVLRDSETPKNLLGKQGWIFYGNRNPQSSIGTTFDYKNTDPFTEDELGLLKDYLENIKNLSEQYGAKFYMFIGPNKNEIYPEYMPDSIKKAEGNTRLQDVEEFLQTQVDINYISVREALFHNKEQYELYYPKGTHWNSIGAYISYYTIMQRIQQDFPEVKLVQEEELVQQEDPDYLGDTPSLKALKTWGDKSATQNILLRYSMPLPYTQLQEENRTIRTMPVEESKQGLKILVLRDSFTSAVQPFLSISFPNAVYYWQYNLTKDMLEEEKPDIVIFEIVQRGLINIMTKESISE